MVGGRLGSRGGWERLDVCRRLGEEVEKGFENLVPGMRRYRRPIQSQSAPHASYKKLIEDGAHHLMLKGVSRTGLKTCRRATSLARIETLWTLRAAWSAMSGVQDSPTTAWSTPRCLVHLPRSSKSNQAPTSDKSK